jgi:hypothetical protein
MMNPFGVAKDRRETEQHHRQPVARYPRHIEHGSAFYRQLT